MTDKDLTDLLSIIERFRDMKPSVTAAEKAIIAWVAAGGHLPVISHPRTGELTEYEVVKRTGRNRVWRSETVVRALLESKGYASELLLEPPRLRSVATIECLLGWQIVNGLWMRPNRGVAVMPVGSGFERAEFA